MVAVYVFLSSWFCFRLQTSTVEARTSREPSPPPPPPPPPPPVIVAERLRRRLEGPAAVAMQCQEESQLQCRFHRSLILQSLSYTRRQCSFFSVHRLLVMRHLRRCSGATTGGRQGNIATRHEEQAAEDETRFNCYNRETIQRCCYRQVP